MLGEIIFESSAKDASNVESAHRKLSYEEAIEEAGKAKHVFVFKIKYSPLFTLPKWNCLLFPVRFWFVSWPPVGGVWLGQRQ